MAEKRQSIQVIVRAGQLLDAIAACERPATLKRLSEAAGLHPSTAFRILSSLTEIGFVRRDSAGCYGFGDKLRQLGCQIGARVDIRREARPIMERLRDQVGETVNLTVREGDEVVYVERATVTRMMRVEQVIGSRAPLHVTAVGKLMLADEGADGAIGYAERTGLPRYTDRTLTDPAALLAELARCRERGHAFDDEEAEPGVGCIGVLVRDGAGAVVAGLSISAPIERRDSAWVGLLRDAARRLSERLGYSQG